ncbi:hypothetical protein Taro_023028 [Colocasia esculenta]|uniref:Receptor-like protein 51 n=1 Tax=Colocasia esculenta TaxID=4460 RepID=A0A843V5C2_COLES|nr:hypothetical protein [Colocasia esculenta]
MGEPRWGLLALLSVLLPYATAAAAAAGGISPAPSPKAPPSRPSAPSARPSPTPATSSSSLLDPKQLTALQSMNLPTTRDPCSLPPPHNFSSCDSAAPFRHVVALTLSNCSSDLDISTTALRALSPTLRSLSFIHCPVPPVKLPSQLASSLLSFSCVASLRRLTGVWLSRLPNLTELTVTDVQINASGPAIVLSQMRRLRTLTISRANLTGFLPRHWHPLNLTRVDLSDNQLKGPIHGSIGMLQSLEFLDVSSNSLTGVLPVAIANMVSLKNVSLARNSLSGPIPETISEMTALVHLDLSSNQFNGSLPKFLTEMKGLKYLNLENNDFHGVFPYNTSFIKRLEVFKVGGNSNLCYNHTLLTSRLKLGISPCDKYGQPLSPPPSRTAPSDSSDYQGYGDGDSGDRSSRGDGGHHGPNKIVLGVAIGLSCLVFLIIFIVCLSKLPPFSFSPSSRSLLNNVIGHNAKAGGVEGADAPHTVPLRVRQPRRGDAAALQIAGPGTKWALKGLEGGSVPPHFALDVRGLLYPHRGEEGGAVARRSRLRGHLETSIRMVLPLVPEHVLKGVAESVRRGENPTLLPPPC